MDIRNIISFANIKKTDYVIWFHFLLNYVTSGSRIVQLIGNICLCLIAFPPNNRLLIIVVIWNKLDFKIQCTWIPTMVNILLRPIFFKYLAMVHFWNKKNNKWDVEVSRRRIFQNIWVLTFILEQLWMDASHIHDLGDSLTIIHRVSESKWKGDVCFNSTFSFNWINIILPNGQWWMI
jgi:hypothetical protein